MSARTLCIAMIALCSLSARASARSIVEFSGDTIGHLGDVNYSKATPSQFGGRPDGVGFKYTFYGFLFVDFWRSDGLYCVYREDEYVVISKAEAAAHLGVPEDELHEPFLYRVPPGLLGLSILLLVGMFVYAAWRINRKEEPDVTTQVYGEALEVFRQTVRNNQRARMDAIANRELWTQTDPWEAAIAFLVIVGVDKVVAEDHLSKILADAIASPNKAA